MSAQDVVKEHLTKEFQETSQMKISVEDRKTFFCELFDTHKFVVNLEHLPDKDGKFYHIMKCSGCGQVVQYELVGYEKIYKSAITLAELYDKEALERLMV